MYNWVTTRKIARTDGPTYPTRAAQTVDAVVAKWIPATAALLACFVTPARADLDARYYESPTYPVRAVQTVDATVRTWIPAFKTEADSYSTPARPPLDVRDYEWSPEFVSIPRLIDPTIAKWEPAFSTELASYVTGARPPLDVRRYDWDAPESGWIQATFAPPATVAQTVPAWTDDGGLTRGRARLDVRTYDWASAFGTPSSAPPDAGGGGNQTTSTGSVGWFVRRVIERTTGPQPVYTAVLPIITPPTVEQTVPAWAHQGGRTGSARALDLFRAQSIPDIFGVPDDWITWVPIQDDGGGRTRDAARLDVRAYDWSQPAWIFKALPVSTATVPQQVGIWTDKGGRTGDRAPLDVRRYEWAPPFSLAPILDATIAKFAPVFAGELASFRTSDDPGLNIRGYEWAPDAASWILASFPPAVPTAQLIPAFLEGLGGQYRTGARPTLDVRTVDWAPAFSWVQPVVDASVARFSPIWSSELASFRTKDDPRLDVRTFAWAPDAGGWMLASFAPPATTAQIWPALLQNLGTEYQTPARAKLDVRAYEWQPEFTWPTKVVDAIVAKWIAVFDAEVSYRTAAARALDVRAITDQPEISWLFPVIPTQVPLTTVLHLDGSYRPIISVTGSYRLTVNMVGSYEQTIGLTGSVEPS